MPADPADPDGRVTVSFAALRRIDALSVDPTTGLPETAADVRDAMLALVDSAALAVAAPDPALAAAIGDLAAAIGRLSARFDAIERTATATADNVRLLRQMADARRQADGSAAAPQPAGWVVRR